MSCLSPSQYQQHQFYYIYSQWNPTTDAGTLPVGPQEDTTFTITATNDSGSDSASVNISVFFMPEITLTVTRAYTPSGGSASYSYVSGQSTSALPWMYFCCEEAITVGWAITGTASTVTGGVYYGDFADDGTNPNIVDVGFSQITGTETLTNKTLTSPKIGTAILDTGGNELINVTATGSAVNEITLANAATGNAPSITASGETNVDLNLSPKGLGRVTLGASKIEQLAEKATIAATAATGTITFDVITQAVLYFTTNAAANYTLNIRGDGSNSLNNIMDTGESLTIAHLVTQGSTPYYNNVVQIDGSTVTPEWQGGSAPSAGNASSVDVYSYTIIKTGDAAFTVFAAQTQFA